MMSIRSLALLQRPMAFMGCESISKRGLKIHPSDPPINYTLPSKGKLPQLSKIPTEFLLYNGKIPRGTREMYRLRGEEKVHNELLLGQYGIVAVHGGLVRTETFKTIRNYSLRKLKKHKNCFAFYRVDPPYKVNLLLTLDILLSVQCGISVQGGFLVFKNRHFLTEEYFMK